MAASIALIALTTATPVEAGLFGPGKFTIERKVDRFATNGLASITAKNNRVSKKSPAGGIYIDDGGVYIEPDAAIKQSDGSLVSLALFVHNETEADTLVGRPNSLGSLERITFIIDGGSPVAFPIKDPINKSSDVASYNSVTHSASSKISERGQVLLTREQFHQIANAGSIAVKLEGSDRDVAFDERDIAKTFLPNLRAFEAVLPALR